MAEMTAEIAVLKRQQDAKCEADKVEMDTEMAMLTQNSKVICPRAITQISMRPTVLHAVVTYTSQTKKVHRLGGF